jgi:hypothetical protein
MRVFGLEVTGVADTQPGSNMRPSRLSAAWSSGSDGRDSIGGLGDRVMSPTARTLLHGRSGGETNSADHYHKRFVRRGYFGSQAWLRLLMPAPYCTRSWDRRRPSSCPRGRGTRSRFLRCTDRYRGSARCGPCTGSPYPGRLLQEPVAPRFHMRKE